MPETGHPVKRQIYGNQLLCLIAANKRECLAYYRVNLARS